MSRDKLNLNLTAEEAALVKRKRSEWGKAGGKARAQKLSPRRRSEIGRLAARGQVLSILGKRDNAQVAPVAPTPAAEPAAEPTTTPDVQGPQ